jgi:hypothetical protein
MLVVGKNQKTIKSDAFAKTHGMAKQKFRSTRLGDFSGTKAYIQYVEILKKSRNAVGRTFCNAMAKQKFRPTRLGGFSGTKAYIQYVEILKKRRNARADFLRRHQIYRPGIT